MKLKSLITIISIASLSVSCTKILDTEPTNFTLEKNYYSTEEELQNGLNGVYDNLGSNELYGRDMLYAYNAQTDEAAFNIWLSSGALAYAYYEYNASTPEIRAFWTALYRGIYRANLLLANIDKPAMNEERRKIIKGEALFLRGYHYFLLASNFGAVPLITEPTKSVTDVSIARTPLKEVYEQILLDMTTAESLLEKQTVTKLGYSGKVTKTAVQGILARVCLQMAGEPLKDRSKYNDAKNWAYKVITSGEHALNKDYTDIFIKLAKDEYDVKESIWEIEFYGNGTGTSEANNFNTLAGIRASDLNIGYNSGRISTTQTLFNLYSVVDPASTAVIRPTLDLRRDWNCANYEYGLTAVGVKTTITRPYSMYMGKWRREYETFTPKTKLSPINTTILRYADVLLMYAEAANEVEGQPTDSAYTAVNLVRKRAYGKELNGNVLKEIKFPAGLAYSTAPTVTIEGGGATTAASATAIIASNRLTGFTITSRGKFYQSEPTVKLNGVAVTGVTATITSLTDADLPLGMSKSDFFNAIVDERARELCFEGYRRMDLLRWNLFVEKMDDLFYYEKAAGSPNTRAFANVRPKHIYMPIPSTELILNRKLTQNPGW